eukprot:PhF_6_TR5625/c1_g2_i1/m.8163
MRFRIVSLLAVAVVVVHFVPERRIADLSTHHIPSPNEGVQVGYDAETPIYNAVLFHLVNTSQYKWLNPTGSYDVPSLLMTAMAGRKGAGNFFGLPCVHTYQQLNLQRSTTAPDEPIVTKVASQDTYAHTLKYVCLDQGGAMYYFPTAFEFKPLALTMRNEIKQKFKLTMHPLTFHANEHHFERSSEAPPYLYRWEKNYHANFWHTLHRLSPIANNYALHHSFPIPNEVIHSITPTETYVDGGGGNNFVKELMPYVFDANQTCHSLHVYQEHAVSASPRNVRCFEELRVGWTRFMSDDPTKNFTTIRNAMLGTTKSGGSRLIITIIHRRGQTRRILNMDDLYERMIKFLNSSEETKNWEVQVVDFAQLASFERQLQVASRTHVLVGITGAGLTWQLVMPRGGAVLEICPYAPPTPAKPSPDQIHMSTSMKKFANVNWKPHPPAKAMRNMFPGEGCNLRAVGVNHNPHGWYGSMAASLGLTHVAYVTTEQEVVRKGVSSVSLEWKTFVRYLKIAMKAVAV